MTTLESWLKDNKLTKILGKLNENDVESLEDLEALDTHQDIEDYAKEMGLSVILKKKFVKAVMKLNNVASPVQYVIHKRPKYDSDDEKKSQQSQNNHEKEMKPKRKVYNLKGLHEVEQLNELRTDIGHKTIMVIGETGTGKTTLLNSMMNYLWQVQYDDPYRFKLVSEKKKKGGQAESQTDVVTAYHLDPPALEYQLTVIDTPGFGDTRGISKDLEITQNIKNFFQTKIQEIDAICFVIQATQARLTASQKYIFDQVLGIFGNDIKDNILALMTFADGKKPPALDALKAGNVPIGKSFKLNNSAFDLPDDDENDRFSRMFWEMGIGSFDELFTEIGRLEPKSLQLTNKVLNRRADLENYILAIQPTIKNGMSVLDELRKQKKLIEDYGDEINSTKNFTYQVQVRDVRQVYNVPEGKNTTTCLQCQYTCHRNCSRSDDADKEKCGVMDRDTGKCKRCANRCHWSLHKNVNYTFEWYNKTVTKSKDHLKARYVDAKSKKSAKEQIMAGTVNELRAVEVELNVLIASVKDCINELSKIALRFNALSQEDYIDKLIATEEKERKDGWEGRRDALKELKMKQDIISKVNKGEYKPWEQYKSTIQFAVTNSNASNTNKGGSIFAKWFGGK